MLKILMPSGMASCEACDSRGGLIVDATKKHGGGWKQVRSKEGSQIGRDSGVVCLVNAPAKYGSMMYVL
jgi:hypothetical protein